MNAIILGAVQALGEFLPISSSAHLALAPLFTGQEYQGVTYDVVLHFGTLLAVLYYFRKDWFNIVRRGLFHAKEEGGKTLWLLALGCVPAGLAGVFFESEIENYLRSPLIIAGALIFFALVLYAADRFASKNSSPKNLGMLDVKTILIIGAAQAIALIPGTSRSGITITAALFLGFGRTESARISFLLSTPVIAGAAFLKMLDLRPSDVNAAFFAGFLTSVILGFLTIKFLMKYLQKANFNVFVVYRIALGLAVLAIVFFR